MNLNRWFLIIKQPEMLTQWYSLLHSKGKWNIQVVAFSNSLIARLLYFSKYFWFLLQGENYMAISIGHLKRVVVSIFQGYFRWHVWLIASKRKNKKQTTQTWINSLIFTSCACHISITYWWFLPLTNFTVYYNYSGT